MTSGINFLAAKSGGLQETLRSLLKGKEAEMLEQADLASPSAAASSLSTQAAGVSNMMSRNFFDAEYENSGYVEARRKGTQASAQLGMSEKSAAASILESMGGVAGPSLYDSQGNKKSGGGGASEATIRRLLKQAGEKEITKDAQAEFEKRRKEEKEGEAAKLLDPNGVQTSVLPEVNMDKAASMPEVSGAPSGASAGVEMSVVPATENAVATAPTMATPSVDLVV